METPFPARVAICRSRSVSSGPLLRGMMGSAGTDSERLSSMLYAALALAVSPAPFAKSNASANAAYSMLESLSESVPALPVMPRNKGPLLTERERQIATLAGNGVSNKDIALEVGISVRTVEGHLYQVFTKLGVSSRSDLLGLI